VDGAIPPTADGANTAQTDHHDVCTPIRGRPVSELPIEVIPPGPDGAVALERERVKVPASGDGGDAGQAAHLGGGVSFRGGAVAKLAIVVLPPGPDRPVALERERVTEARSDGDNIARS